MTYRFQSLTNTNNWVSILLYTEVSRISYSSAPENLACPNAYCWYFFLIVLLFLVNLGLFKKIVMGHTSGLIQFPNMA